MPALGNLLPTSAQLRNRKAGTFMEEGIGGKI
jgi:hypothetical protein